VFAANTYVVARLAHYTVYMLGIPVARTVAFLVGIGAILMIAAVQIGITG